MNISCIASFVPVYFLGIALFSLVFHSLRWFYTDLSPFVESSVYKQSFALFLLEVFLYTIDIYFYMSIRFFLATKAFISYQGQILVLRESPSYEETSNTGFYDVVGGRLDPGEHFGDALTREVYEETGLKVTMGRPFFVNEWRPVVRGEQWHIVGIFFACEADNQTVVLSKDHDDYKWIDPKEYKQEHIIENLSFAFDAYLTR